MVLLAAGAKPGSKIRGDQIRIRRLLEAFFALFICELAKNSGLQPAPCVGYMRAANC
jgi:hypothetical protein